MTNQDGKHIIEPESLAQLFLRLNGFFALNHFIVHRSVEYNYKVGYNTYIAGIRFPHRTETLTHLLSDDERLTHLELPLLLLGEMKTDLCEFNKNWLNPDSERLKRILVATGLFPTTELDTVLMALRSKGWYKNSQYMVQSVCFGGKINPDLNMPEVIQLTWEDLLRFVFECFQIYAKNKLNYVQWEQMGQMIWHIAIQTPIYKAFRAQFVVEKGEKDTLSEDKSLLLLSKAVSAVPEVNDLPLVPVVPASKPKTAPKPTLAKTKKQEIINPQTEAIKEFLYRLETKLKTNKPKSVDAFLSVFKSQMKRELTHLDLLKFIAENKNPVMQVLSNGQINYHF